MISARSFFIPLAIAGAAVAADRFVLAAHGADPQKPAPAASRTAITHALPAMDGRHLEATITEVNYEPGRVGAPHQHPCPVIGYVLAGKIRMQIKGQSEKTYGPGETFTETPPDVHLVGANASATEPAKFLAFFVCDHKTPLTVPVTGEKPGAGPQSAKASAKR